MKIPNLGFSVFLRGSVSRVYQLQDRSSCRMRSLHYSTLEYTRSFIKIIAKRKKKKIFLIPPPVTTAEIRPSRNLAETKRKKKKIFLIPPPVTTAEIRPSRNLAEKMTKNENSKFWSQRVPERQHRQGLPTASSSRMRYLHYSTLENTRSFI